MANAQQISKLKQGAKFWQEWRSQNNSIVLDFNAANLSGIQIEAVNLAKANLVRADLSDTELIAADIVGADLTEAD